MAAKQDLLEKGASVQRGKNTYAIAPHIPGGIILIINETSYFRRLIFLSIIVGVIDGIINTFGLYCSYRKIQNIRRRVDENR